MAAALQCARAHRLGRADLRLRARARQPVPAADLSRRVGHGAFPVGTLARGRFRAVATDNARVVFCNRGSGSTFDRWPAMETAIAGAATACAGDWRPCRRGWDRRRPRITYLA